MGLGFAGSGFDLFVRDLVRTKGDVFRQRAAEKENILLNNADL